MKTRRTSPKPSASPICEAFALSALDAMAQLSQNLGFLGLRLSDVDVKAVEDGGRVGFEARTR